MDAPARPRARVALSRANASANRARATSKARHTVRRADVRSVFLARSRSRVAASADEGEASSSSNATLRSVFDAVRGAVLAPAEGGSSASGTGPALARVRDAVAGFVAEVSVSFDDAWGTAGDGDERALGKGERRRRARTLTAERKRRAREVKTRAELRALRPSVEIRALSADERAAMGLQCDEMHFVPVGDCSGWSLALLRYRAREGGSRASTSGTPRPIVMVPGCASNAMTFDVDESVSLPRYLAKRGHEVWVVETRGVGYARQWTRPPEDYVTRAKVDKGKGKEIEIPAMRSVGFGLWDFDTLLNEDVFCACEYVAAVCGRGDLAAIGHSMGGMLLASLAAIGPKVTDIGINSPWSITRVCTIASCLECSEESDPESPVSVYARFSTLAGHLPRGLTANPSVVTAQIPMAPASVATAEAFQFVLGPPPPIDGDGSSAKPDPAKAFWQNSVSPVTCHPGATDSEFLRRLLLRGFDNVPLSLLIQMATLFTPGGLRSRDPTMGVDDTSGIRARRALDGERLRYIDELARARVPALAITGDVDPIFPPNQVRAYAKKIGAECHVFGDPSAPRDDPDAHFSHYDVICGRHATKRVFPIIAEFVERA